GRIDEHAHVAARADLGGAQLAVEDEPDDVGRGAAATLGGVRDGPELAAIGAGPAGLRPPAPPRAGETRNFESLKAYSPGGRHSSASARRIFDPRPRSGNLKNRILEILMVH